MGRLHEMFEKVRAEFFASDTLPIEILKRTFQAHSVELSKEQAVEILGRIKRAKGELLTIDIPGHEHVHALITDEDCAVASESVLKDVESATYDVIGECVPKLAQLELEQITLGASETLCEHYADTRGFESRLLAVWKDGLASFDLLILAAVEAANEFCEERAASSADCMDDDPEAEDKFAVLRGLHIRACRTALEISALLKAGYADGANARWRTLHELAVTAMFIAENDSQLAVRFTDHSGITRFRAAAEHRRYAKQLGDKQMPAREFRELRSVRDSLIKQYGESFREDYGWATPCLNGKRATFATIEDCVDLSQWRPYYRWACDSIHAGAKSLEFSLGNPPDGSVEVIGPSVYGLFDPGQSASISLMQASSAFLTVEPTLDQLVACKILDCLAERAIDALYAAHEQLEAD